MTEENDRQKKIQDLIAHFCCHYVEDSQNGTVFDCDVLNALEKLKVKYATCSVKLPVPDTKDRYSQDSLPYQLGVALMHRVDSRCNTYQRFRGLHQHWELLIQKQAYYFDRLLTKQGKCIEELMEVLEHSQNNDFWKQNVLSGYKFMLHYDKIFQQIDVPDVVDSNPDLTAKLIGIYRALINNPKYHPNKKAKAKFSQASIRMKEFYADKDIDPFNWVEYLLACLEKVYTNKSEHVYPGNLCSDHTWEILMPQYLADIGL
jgi:hypothetical protein